MTAAPELAGQVDAGVHAGGSQGRYLGPATVTEVGAVLAATLPSGETVSPQLALAFPFTPAVGDSLLLVGQDARYYVIGVIASRGETPLRFKGDVEVRAVDGALELHGDEGVEVRGPRVDIKTKKLTVIAEKATEAFGTVFTRVKELMSVHTGETDTVVRGQYSNRAKRTSITSEEAVTINGKQVHLG